VDAHPTSARVSLRVSSADDSYEYLLRSVAAGHGPRHRFPPPDASELATPLAGRGRAGFIAADATGGGCSPEHRGGAGGEGFDASHVRR